MIQSDQRSIDDAESVNTVVTDTHTGEEDDSDPPQVLSGNNVRQK